MEPPPKAVTGSTHSSRNRSPSLLQILVWPSGCSRANLDSSVNITLDQWARVHRTWHLRQARRALLWARVSFGRFTWRWAWRWTSWRRFFMVDTDTLVCVAALSCPLMRLEVLVRAIVACLVMQRSSYLVVFRGRPDRGLSCTLPVACQRCYSLQMTEGATPSRLATSRTAILCWSQAMARPLSTSVRQRLWTMVMQWLVAEIRGLIKKIA